MDPPAPVSAESKTVDPPAPAKPMDPPAPAKPMDPPAPAKPMEPPAPAKPMDPPAPAKPMDPPAPAKPMEPPAPAKPMDPPAPVKPMDPPAPAKPMVPPAPAKTMEPPAPAKPMDPPSPPKTMDPPASKTEKTNETNNHPITYECGFYDTEVVYKIAQELLPGLASACVDNTTGGIFKSAGSVAVDMRKDMADYLLQRSETYVAEFLLSENAPALETSEHPYDIILTLVDDFAAIKRNMFSRVSEWVLSDRREDRIDDFVQEIDINGFWLLARRECIASMLVKNVDYKNAFHCNVVYESEKEVMEHRLECTFRAMDCVNEGCTTRYCAGQKENHEAVCPFMILPCEQKCSDFVMRREMDRHCVTICPMKLVNCAFYTVGCKSCIPKCNVQQHNADGLSEHLLFIIRTAHRGANEDDLKHRVEQIRNLSNVEKLARARDARALTYLIKDIEAKLGPLQTNPNPNPPESPTNKPDPSTENPAIKEEVNQKSPKPTESSESPDSKDKQESSSSPLKNESSRDSSKEEEKGKPSDNKEEERTRSPQAEKVQESIKSPKKETITEEDYKSDEQDLKNSPKKETESPEKETRQN